MRGEPRQPAPHRRGLGGAAAALTRRQPCPAARASSAAQITATASTRRPSTDRGNSTRERPQPPAPEQIARRGRIPPHRTRSLSHEPSRRMPRRRQPLTTPRTRQLPRDQLLFDTDDKTYAEQRTASRRVRTALPGRQDNQAGRAVGYQDRPAKEPAHPHPDAPNRPRSRRQPRPHRQRPKTPRWSSLHPATDSPPDPQHYRRPLPLHTPTNHWVADVKFQTDHRTGPSYLKFAAFDLPPRRVTASPLIAVVVSVHAVAIAIMKPSPP